MWIIWFCWQKKRSNARYDVIVHGVFRVLKDRRLELNMEKLKILVFNRRSRDRKEKWLWNSIIIEEVQEFKYLGFVISNKEKYKESIKELSRKGRKKGVRREYAKMILRRDGRFSLGAKCYGVEI